MPTNVKRILTYELGGGGAENSLASYTFARYII